MKKYIVLLVALLSSVSSWADVDTESFNNANFLVDKDETAETAWFSVDKTNSSTYQSFTFSADTVKIPETISTTKSDGVTPITYKIIGVRNLCLPTNLKKIVVLPDNATSLSPDGKNKARSTSYHSSSYPGYITGVSTLILSKGIATISNIKLSGTNSDYNHYISVKKYEVASANTNYSADDEGVLYNSDKSILYFAPWANRANFIRYTIPSSVTEISANAFHSFSYLERITVKGNNLQTIGNYAFYACTSLTEFESSNTSLTTIGSYAFSTGNSSYRKLSQFSFTDNIQSIGTYAFQYAYFDNTEFTFPKNLTTIGQYAFENAFNGTLKKLIIPAEQQNKLNKTNTGNYLFGQYTTLPRVDCYIRDPQGINANIFYYSPTKIYVPTGSINQYKSRDGWKNWSTSYEESIDLIPESDKTSAPEFAWADADSTLTIKTSTTGAKIYYTTDGTEPTNASTLYSSPIKIKQYTVVKAISYLDGKVAAAATFNVDFFSLMLTIEPYVKNNLMFVKFTTNEKDATIKYTKGSNPADPSGASGIPYDSNTTVSVVDGDNVRAYAYKEGYNPASESLTISTTDLTCTKPTAVFNTLEDGTILLTMTTDTDGATIYYTSVDISSDSGADPGTPTSESTKYPSTGIVVKGNFKYKAVAIKSNMLNSSVTTVSSTSIKTFTATKPVMSLVGSYSESGAVVLKATISTGSKNSTEAAQESYYYRIGGSGAYTLYSAPVTVHENEYFYSYAVIPNWKASGSDYMYVSSSSIRCAIPSFSADRDNHKVLVTTTTEDAQIYYTLDGSTPTTKSSKYDAETGIVLENNCTVSAIAVKEGMLNSNTASTTYNNWFACADVVAEQIYENGAMKMKLTCSTDDAVIHYGVGSRNTYYPEEMPVYTEPVQATNGTTIYYIAMKENFNNSNWGSKQISYTGYKQCARPSISLDDEKKLVSITTTEDSVDIYYQIQSPEVYDGIAPTTADIKYTEPFALTSNCYVKAIAAKDSTINSEMESVYVEDWFRLARVTFEPQYNADSTYAVKLSHDVEGVTIRYYYDSDQTIQIYDSVAVTVPLGEYIYADASKEGQLSSGYYSFRITKENFKVRSPQIATNSETKKLIVTCETRNAAIYYTYDGSVPTTESTKLEGDTLDIVRNGEYKFIAVKDKMDNSSVSSYKVDWFRVPQVTITPFAEDNVLKVRLTCEDSDATIYYATSSDYNYENVASNALYKEPFEVSDGAYVYASAIKEGFNNANWSSYGYIYRSSYTCNMPTITIAADTTVTITSSSEDETIYYTLNGEDPTTSSTKFTSKFKLESNVVVKAIAVSDEKLASSVRTKQYNGFSVANVTITPFVEDNKLKIKLATTTPGAKIYYALNETNSEVASNLPYTAPFEVTDGTYVYANALKDGYNEAGWNSFGWIYLSSYTCNQPTITIKADTTVVMSANESATIYYTLDGTDPTTSSTKYTSEFKLTHNVDIRAIAVEAGMISSSVRQRTYNSFYTGYPQFSLDGTKMTITSSTPNVNILYAYEVDPRDATTGSIVYSRKYTAPFDLEYNGYIYVKVEKENFQSTNGEYWASDIVRWQKPEVLSNNGHAIKFKEIPGATIWYTTNGDYPGSGNYGSFEYKDSILLTGTGTIRAMAQGNYKNNSEVAEIQIKSYAGENGATSEKAGGLATSMGWANLSEITEFAVTGPINADDIKFIKDKMTSIKRLNLSAATVDDGNIPDNAFANMPLLEFSSPNGLQSVGDNIFTGCDNLAAVVWNTTAKIPDNAFDADVNPNLLLFVPSEEAAPTNSSAQNIIVNGTAKNIYLSDGEGNNFHCPQGFYAQNITYTHNFKLESGDGYGWETIALPFECSRFIHESKGELLPFAAYDSLTEKGMYKPFWLRELTDVGFKDVSRIEANKPYIISMPNNDGYASRYRLGGKVTFTSTDTWVPVTEPQAVQKGVNTLYANFLNDDSTDDIMLLNTVETDGKKAGSIFVKRSGRALRPFEAYVVSRATTRAAISISRGFSDDPDGDDDTTPIETVNQQTTGKMVKVYTLSGVLVKEAAEEDALKGLAKGVYIVNGKSMIVK